MFEIKVQRSVFLKALSYVQSIADRKTISEIHSHLKLEAAGTNVTMTTLDNTLSITTTIPAEIEHNGALTLPVHTLYDIVRKLSDETITLKIDPNQTSMVEISSGYSTFHLAFLKAEKFPRIDAGSFDCTFSLTISAMQKIIEKNRYTISQEDSRYHLNGIYFHPILDMNELRGTATDGHRLSSTKIQLPKDAKNMHPMIIPRKTIFEIAKIIADKKEGEIFIESSTNKIKFTIDNLIIISKLIDADFPDYLGLIPYNNDLFFSISSIELARAVDRVATILAEKSHAIEFNIAQNLLEIRAAGDQHSLANDKLEITSNIELLKIPFNARYILDIMNSIGNEAIVEFRLKDQVSPILIQAQEDNKTDFVIMPMRS